MAKVRKRKHKTPKTRTPKKIDHGPLFLPALAGRFGDWMFYVCLMEVTEIAKRVSYATEIHKSKRLSDMIQRELQGKRAAQIAEYIHTQEQRFFSSLVIGLYGGAPDWHGIGLKNVPEADIAVGDMTVAARESFGVLSLAGTEALFALDGQHRLAGIREAKKKKWLEEGETLSVLLVAHDNDSPEGLARTRRLFTTLNKTAKAVSDAERIALDQDDPVAVCTRWLVEEFFDEEAIKTERGNTIASTDRKSFTTIKALYDALRLFLPRISGLKSRAFANKPASDRRQAKLQKHARRFFEWLGAGLTDLELFWDGSTRKHKRVLAAHRQAAGGHLLFRPIGFLVFVDAVSRRWGQNLDRTQIVAALRKLPLQIDEPPFAGVIWDPVRKAVNTKGRALARDLLLHMLGGEPELESELLAEWLGEDFDLTSLPVLSEEDLDAEAEDEDEDENEDSADDDEADDEDEEEDDDDDEDEDEVEEDDEDDDDDDEDGDDGELEEGQADDEEEMARSKKRRKKR